jgi:hypothetical protein
MFRVSGPNYVSVYVVNGCTVSFFGDIHYSKQDSCSNCHKSNNCITIIQVYDRLIQNKKRADIFLEAHYFDKKHLNYKDNLKLYYSNLTKSEGWLREAVKHFKAYMYGKQHNATSPVHIHYGDLRRHSSLEYLYWIKYVFSSKDSSHVEQSDIEVAVALLEDLRTKHHLKKIGDAMVKSNDFKQQMESMFGKNAWIYTDETSLTGMQGMNIKVHRIRKQILKLSPKLQKAVLRYHDEQARDILMDYHCHHYTKSRRELLHRYAKTQKLEYSEASLCVNTCIDKWLSHFMELYMLTRMLYTIEKGSKNVSSFTGANHAYIFDYFFKNYIADAHKVWEYDSEMEKATEKRCVHIPQDTMQHLLNYN